MFYSYPLPSCRGRNVADPKEHRHLAFDKYLDPVRDVLGHPLGARLSKGPKPPYPKSSRKLFSVFLKKGLSEV